MWIESFWWNENTELQNNSLLNQREVFDLKWYSIELRNKQERIKLLESREWELDSLETVLNQNPDTKIFYIHKWNYYPNNPLRVAPENPSDIIYLQIESKEEIQGRINILKESLVEDKITLTTQKLDGLIDNTFRDNPNMRTLLIELRIWLSWFEKSSYLSWAESINTMIHLLEKYETATPSVWEMIKILFHWFNIIRYIPHYWAKAWFSALKDITSNQLHWFWNKKAPLEEWLENSIIRNNYIPDSIETETLAIAKIPWATIAGWIDWALDFIQAYIDIKIVPDKVIMWLLDTIPFVYDNFYELWWMVIEWIEEASDIAYIISYISVVIVLTLKVDMWAGALTIPKVVWDLLKKSWISAEIITQIQNNIISHSKEITSKATWIITVSKKVSEQSTKVRDFADNTATAMQRFKGVSGELANSRKVLNTLNKTLVLADIFWEKIQAQLDNKNNTDIALKVYEEQILKWSGFVLSKLEGQIDNSSWELQYNLIRIREKFDELKNIFEREIFPVKLQRDKLKDKNDLLWLSKLDKYYSWKLRDMRELTRLILPKYVLDK